LQQGGGCVVVVVVAQIIQATDITDYEFVVSVVLIRRWAVSL